MKSSLDNLLVRLEEIFNSSKIKQKCDSTGIKWSYSLITTPMIKDRPLIVGYNWGAEENYNYEPQRSVEPQVLDPNDMGSLKRSWPYFAKFIPDDIMKDASQTNFCFFRSKKESDVNYSDMMSCKQIFEELIEIVEPSMIICLSAKLRNYLVKNKMISDLKFGDVKFEKGNTKIVYRSIKGLINNSKKIYCLPHPNYRMEKKARDAAWQFCFSDN